MIVVVINQDLIWYCVDDNEQPEQWTALDGVDLDYEYNVKEQHHYIRLVYSWVFSYRSSRNHDEKTSNSRVHFSF